MEHVTKSKAREAREARPLAEREVWNVKDVEQYLGIHEKDVYALAKAGTLPHRRIGRRLRFYRDDIRAFMRSEDAR